jgi:TonB family protein
VTPKYPAQAIASRKGGQVVLVARLLKDGTIGSLRPVQVTGAGCGFPEASMEAVRQWKYHPATKAGQPVEVEFTIIVDFVPTRYGRAS